MPNRWNEFANLRRIQIESGLDITFNDVFIPYFINIICKLRPEKVIEIGSGTGHLSKAVAKQGFAVTAIEPSDGMFKVSQDVLKDENIELFNCSSRELQIEKVYDLAFSHLVAHVTEDVECFISSIAVHLNSGAHFIFSIPHPCFYNEYKNFLGDEYNYMERMIKEVAFYITKDPINVISGVPYHHRPLSEYVNSIVASGFALEVFDEIYPSKEIQKKYGKDWVHPRYCVFICRKI